MKLSCDGNDLTAAVAKAIKALGTKAVNPVLECIKLDAEAGSLTLTAADTELRIETTICADVDMTGSILVPGKLFSDFTKKLVNQKIELEESGTKLKVCYFASQGELSCSGADDFPASVNLSEVGDGVKSVTIKSAELRDLIAKVAFAVAISDKMPILKGVLLDVKDGAITGVAIDGCRLAKSVKPIVNASDDFSVVVPSRSLNEMARLLEETDSDVTLKVFQNKVRIDLGHTVVTAQLLTGDFPQYKRIIPSFVSTTVKVLTEPLLSGLDRAALLTREDKSNPVFFSVTDKVLSLSSASGAGNLDEKINIIANGEDIDIAFNCKFMTDALKACGSEQVTVKFTGPNKPCVIEPCGGGEDFTYLILPVRT